MAGTVPKILLTGLPGCGKTTAIIRICAGLKHLRLAGFFTEEIRVHNNRTGFRWKKLDGTEGILAHVDIKSRFRVGKYGVDVEGFERDVVPILDVERSDAELFVIDEIGKMECFSQKFVEAIRRLFIADKPVLAAVAQKGAGLIAEVKDYPMVKLFNLNERNRDSVAGEIIELLSTLKQKGSADG